MKLNLKRPIIFFDLETTGVDTAKDRIVEISMAKIMPDGEEIVKTRKLNPEMHIPEEATAIHGITDEDVKDCPTFAQVAKSLEQFIRGCDFGGFNSNRFDLPVLVEEFLRAGVDVDFKRPIIFFDLETTGVDTAKDRIVEISMAKIMPDGEEIVKTRKLNPEMHIPEEATAIHGITDEDVKDCPTFAQVAKSLEQFIRGCDFGGFNSNRFDLPVLVEEFLRAGVDVDFKRRKFIDVQNIFHKKEQRTLVAAYKFYCDKDLDDAHSAEADTLATYEVLKAQLERYPDLENDIDKLAEFSTRAETADYAGRILFNEKGEEVFGFGKYKGRSVEEVFRMEPSYYAWMMNGDFPLYTKKVITEIRMREKLK